MVALILNVQRQMRLKVFSCRLPIKKRQWRPEESIVMIVISFREARGRGYKFPLVIDNRIKHFCTKIKLNMDKNLVNSF